MSNIILIDERYKNGKIYGLYRKDNNELIYVGSTIKTLNERFSNHRNRCNNSNSEKYLYKVYQYIRENGNIDNIEIRIIQDFPCRNKMDLTRREGWYIQDLKPLCNVFVAGRTRKEYHKKYHKEHKEELKEYHKKYWEEHKKEKKEYDKKRYKILSQKYTCSICNAISTIIHKSRHERSQRHLSALSLQKS